MRGISVSLAALLLAACGDSSTADPDGGGTGSDGAGSDGGGQDPVTRDDAIRACVLLASCGGGGDGVADCFTDVLPLLSAAHIGCVLEAGTDCAASRACVGILGVEVDPDCVPSCDGDVLVDCGDGVRATYDCGDYVELPGQTCVVGNFGPECGAGTCDQEESSCDQDAVLACDVDRGVIERGDCARFGLSCDVDDGTARCSDGTATPCADDPPRCDGDSLARCSGGYQVAFDCGFVIDARGCHQTTETGAFCGFGDACEPLTAKGEETCDGTVITFCAAGAIESVDCADLGFTGCRESLGGGACTSL